MINGLAVEDIEIVLMTTNKNKAFEGQRDFKLSFI